MRISLSVLVLLLAIGTARADYRGRVIRIVDGDTVEVLREGRADKASPDAARSRSALP